MRDLNSVQLIGRLGQDPDVQYSDTGTARTTFSIATNRAWTDAESQVLTETEWTRCTAWGRIAEIAAEYLHKGSRVYVQGRLHTSRWEDAQTGETRASVELVLDDLILLDRPTPAVPLHDGKDTNMHEPAAEPASAPLPPTQQPIRRQLRPVQLPDAPASSPKRPRTDQ